MGGEWDTATIDEVAERVAMGPFGSSIKVETFVAQGVPVISGQHLHGFRLDETSGFNFLSPEHANRLKNANVQKGDIIFTHAGNIGQVSYIPESSEYERYVISQRQFYMRCNRQRVIPEFVVYYFNTPEGRHKLLANTSQVGVPSIAQPVTYLRTIEIPLPPLPEQRAIAHILGTLDDKIELNRRMNDTLEAIAQPIFKSWFVNFDPVRAKMEGHWKKGENLPCLPARLWDLFPDSFEDSELGDIPRGWKVQRLGDIIELAYGKALKEENRRVGSIPVFGSNGQVGWHDQKLVDGPGIIVGRKGNPGIVTWAPTDFFAIDTTFYVVPKNECGSLHFLYYALLGHDLASLGADSAVPGLNRNLAYMNLQVSPQSNVIEGFDRQVKPLFDKTYANKRESRTLAALRDTLMPKLITGELRLKDAEKIVGKS
ncbi:MAG: restriction endonuclease subunit S [Candidatus Eisenbacteria bacterium]|nr:restriction endonuclease subunit S [Candidatus Eisenbacteria bacterium]